MKINVQSSMLSQSSTTAEYSWYEYKGPTFVVQSATSRLTITEGDKIGLCPIARQTDYYLVVPSAPKKKYKVTPQRVAAVFGDERHAGVDPRLARQAHQQKQMIRAEILAAVGIQAVIDPARGVVRPHVRAHPRTHLLGPAHGGHHMAHRLAPVLEKQRFLVHVRRFPILSDSVGQAPRGRTATVQIMDCMKSPWEKNAPSRKAGGETRLAPVGGDCHQAAAGFRETTACRRGIRGLDHAAALAVPVVRGL